MSMKKQRCDEVPTVYSVCKKMKTMTNRSYQPVVTKDGSFTDVNSPSAIISCTDSLSSEICGRTGLQSRALYNSKCRESKSCFLKQHRGNHALATLWTLSLSALKDHSMFSYSYQFHHIMFHVLRNTSDSVQLSRTLLTQLT